MGFEPMITVFKTDALDHAKLYMRNFSFITKTKTFLVKITKRQIGLLGWNRTNIYSF